MAAFSWGVTDVYHSGLGIGGGTAGTSAPGGSNVIEIRVADGAFVDKTQFHAALKTMVATLIAEGLPVAFP